MRRYGNSTALRRRAPSATGIPGAALGLCLLSLTAVLPSGRAAAESLPAAISACRGEIDAAQRLRCYDAEVDRIEAVTGRLGPPAVNQSVTAPNAAAPISAAPGAAAPVSAGASLPPAAAAPSSAAPALTATPPPRAHATLPMFRAKIVAMSFRRAGEFVITLDNGQVWTQYVTEGKARIGVGDSVLIRPGFMGAYILKGPTDWITKVHLLGADPES